MTVTLSLKPIEEQVVVITGASSGIGLVTAKMAARRGARVVLTARNEDDLLNATEHIRREGGRAVYVVADVSDLAQVEEIGRVALREFGRIDTWVNNAAVSVYGRIMEMSVEHMRRQFDVNYWGYVYGCRVAVPHLRQHGGALINVASALADRAIPLQGTYCAAKHAIKAFTDALRMELHAEGTPISVTLVKPSSIDTPFFDKAKTYLSVEPQPVPPVYAPEIAAETILTCAQRPVRDVTVGGAGALLQLAELAPQIADEYMERTMFAAQQTEKPVGNRADNLYRALPYDGGERGQNWTGRTRSVFGLLRHAPRETSLYTTTALLAGTTTATIVGLGIALVGALLLGSWGALDAVWPRQFADTAES